jgi:predicted TIM-barrel enzyme
MTAGPTPVFRTRPNPLEAIFGRRKVVIGVIHLRPLPGAPAYDGEAMAAIIEHAATEAARYRDGGVAG